MQYLATYMFFLLMIPFSCGKSTVASSGDAKEIMSEEKTQQDLSKYSKAYFASGCFWCVEAIYESVEGVAEVISGYAEGIEANATYPKVSSGRTNHVEAIEVYYDPAIITYETLVKVFFGSGDPTTLNRQGGDAGYQYRSAIYFQNESEKNTAVAYKEQLEKDKVFKNPIVTDITAYTTFFPAEEYHQDFEVKNPNQGYVRAVSVPRLKKFQAAFPELLKKKGH